jgi:hypothetical protein
MSIKLAALAGLLSLAAAPAFADTLITASLVQPVNKPAKIIVSDLLWSCDGATCNTQVPDERAASVSLCRELTREVGAVASYGSFASDQLAKCNAGRPGQTTASAR